MPTSNNDLQYGLYNLGRRVKDNEDLDQLHTSDIKELQHSTKSLKDDLASTAHIVELHAGDIHAIMGYIQALAMRLSRIEDQLGITEPVVVPGD